MGGERIATDHRKIVVREAHGSRPARIFALCGASAMREALIEWVEHGAIAKDMPSVKDAQFTLLVIEADAAGRPTLKAYTDNMPYVSCWPIPNAFGTGGERAHGALLYGATARQAVEIACRLDTCSGGDIQEEDIAAALKLPVPANGLGKTRNGQSVDPSTDAIVAP